MLGQKLVPDVRASPMRQRIYDAVMQKPGRTFLDVVRAVGVAGYGTTQYHLYVLERLGLIHHVKAGRSVHYYPTGGVAPREAREDAVTADPTRNQILAHVRQTPGVTMGDLAAKFLATRQNTGYHVERLRREGLVVVERDATNHRFKRVRPAQANDVSATVCEECDQGPSNIALLPDEACTHGCGCVGLEVAA